MSEALARIDELGEVTEVTTWRDGRFSKIDQRIVVRQDASGYRAYLYDRDYRLERELEAAA